MRRRFLAGVAALMLAGVCAAAPAAPAEAARAPAADSAGEGIRVLLTPALETTLVSQIAGVVREVEGNIGQSFGKGRVLVAFDCEEQNARLKMAEAELAAAREDHEAKLRLQGMQQASAVEVSIAASTAARARAQVGLYRAQLSQCTVRAPFAGRIVRVSVKPHQGVSQGQALLDIISDGPLKLRLNAPAAWVRWLKIGLRFEVAIDETGKRYEARVSAVNGRIDAVSQSIELEATIASQAPELLAGMSGTAHFSQPKL